MRNRKPICCPEQAQVVVCVLDVPSHSFAYKCLCLLGQLGLTEEIVPICHSAKRSQLKTVLLEEMYRVAMFVAHVRRLVLDFGRGLASHEAFVALLDRLLRAVRHDRYASLVLARTPQVSESGRH